MTCPESEERHSGEVHMSAQSLGVIEHSSLRDILEHNEAVRKGTAQLVTLHL